MTLPHDCKAWFVSIAGFVDIAMIGNLAYLEVGVAAFALQQTWSVFFLPVHSAKKKRLVARQIIFANSVSLVRVDFCLAMGLWQWHWWSASAKTPALFYLLAKILAETLFVSFDTDIFFMRISTCEGNATVSCDAEKSVICAGRFATASKTGHSVARKSRALDAVPYLL